MLPCAFGCRGASPFGGVLHIAWNARFLFFPFFSSSFPEFFFHGEFLPAFSFLSFLPVVLSSFPPVLFGWSGRDLQQLVHRMSSLHQGGYSGGVPPLPIPNREVKPARADGTARKVGE